MDLYIVRHAWAGQRDDSRWPDDGMRPLTAEGKERFARVVRKLGGAGMAPGIIAASPLVRCVETAEILAAGLDGPKIVKLDELQPGSDLQGLLRWTARQAAKHEQIAWVGHAPDVDRLAAALIGDAGALIHFGKGTVADIRFDAEPAVAAGELQWLVSAKVLGC
jgi:phosphohistidine phosphatase SixA